MRVRCPHFGCKENINGKDEVDLLARFSIHFYKIHNQLLTFDDAALLAKWAERMEKKGSKNELH